MGEIKVSEVDLKSEVKLKVYFEEMKEIAENNNFKSLEFLKATQALETLEFVLDVLGEKIKGVNVK